jgi:hypothetical protein
MVGRAQTTAGPGGGRDQGRDKLNTQRRELPMVRVDKPDALGPQEDWELPRGRNTGLGAAAGTSGVRYHDEY